MAFLDSLAEKIKANFAKKNHIHTEYEAKNANIQTHISSTLNPHGTTASQVGLANVTNDRQIKASASSTTGYIPTWASNSGDLLGAGYSVQSTLSNSSTAIPLSSAVSTAISNLSAGIAGGLFAPVQNLTALKAIDTTNASAAPDKYMINVEDSGLFRLDRESSATANDNTVIQPTVGVGRWLKMSSNLTDHNLLSSIQGGATGEYNHLNNTQLASIPTNASGSNKLIVANEPKLINLDANGQINIDNVVVTSAQMTAFENALNA